jgi:hypothetical protein
MRLTSHEGTRAFRHEVGAADKRAAKRGRTPLGVCNAPYARVLRAQKASFSAAFRWRKVAAVLAQPGSRRQPPLEPRQAKSLIWLGTLWLPSAVFINY